jgi:hypothetical protein
MAVCSRPVQTRSAELRCRVAQFPKRLKDQSQQFHKTVFGRQHGSGCLSCVDKHFSKRSLLNLVKERLQSSRQAPCWLSAYNATRGIWMEQGASQKKHKFFPRGPLSGRLQTRQSGGRLQPEKRRTKLLRASASAVEGPGEGESLLPDAVLAKLRQKGVVSALGKPQLSEKIFMIGLKASDK